MQKLNYDELLHKANYFRRNPTYHEQVAMSKLDMKPKNFYKFQVAFGWYILDFVIPSKMLIVELDGASHLYREQHDTMRDKFCNECGFRVLRLPNEEAKNILLHVSKYADMQDWDKKLRRSIGMAKERRLTEEKAKIEHMLRPVVYKKRK